MICFPLDNTPYEADALGAWCGTRIRGVFASDTHYNVTANGDMTVTVGPGLAWLKADTFWGVNAYEANPQVLSVETADGSLSRIDAVCVRIDKNRNLAQTIIKKGAYSPQPPTITPPARNLDFDEIYVATITVRAGATSILTTDIVDQRLNESYCGIMRDGVTGIPTQKLYDQWMAWFEQTQDDASAYFARYRQMIIDLFMQYQSEISVYEGSAQAAYESYVDRINTYETAQKADWEAWVDSLRDILDKEVAGHLQLEIEELQTRVPTAAIGTVSTQAASATLYPLCKLFKTSWAFGMGGAGLGPAGGSSMMSIETDIEYDGYSATISAPSAYRNYTTVTQLSDTTYAFIKDDPNDTTSIVLKIYKEG